MSQGKNNGKKRSGILGTMYSASMNTKYKTVRSAEKRKFPLLIIACAVITTLLFMFIVFSFMQITQIKADIADMNAAVRTLQKEERKITMELEGKYSSKIESIASDMGLSGGDANTIYLENDKSLEITEIITPEKPLDSTMNSLMSAVGKSLRKFIEFID
ncbi:MAG: hypothetical protein ACI4QR_07225 [Eubacteriales bacterium]